MPFVTKFFGVISGVMETLSCKALGGFRLTQNWSDSGKIEQFSNRQTEAIHLMRKGEISLFWGSSGSCMSFQSCSPTFFFFFWISRTTTLDLYVLFLIVHIANVDLEITNPEKTRIRSTNVQEHQI